MKLLSNFTVNKGYPGISSDKLCVKNSVSKIPNSSSQLWKKLPTLARRQQKIKKWAVEYEENSLSEQNFDFFK